MDVVSPNPHVYLIVGIVLELCTSDRGSTPKRATVRSSPALDGSRSKGADESPGKGSPTPEGAPTPARVLASDADGEQTLDQPAHHAPRLVMRAGTLGGPSASPCEKLAGCSA